MSPAWENLLLGIKRFHPSHWNCRATIFSNGNRALRFSELMSNTNFSIQDVKPQLMGFHVLLMSLLYLLLSTHEFSSPDSLFKCKLSWKIILNFWLFNKFCRHHTRRSSNNGMPICLKLKFIQTVLDKSLRIKFAYLLSTKLILWYLLIASSPGFCYFYQFLWITDWCIACCGLLSFDKHIQVWSDYEWIRDQSQ